MSVLHSALSTVLAAGLSSPLRANDSSLLRTWLSHARPIAKKLPPNLQVVLRFHVWGVASRIRGPCLLRAFNDPNKTYSLKLASCLTAHVGYCDGYGWSYRVADCWCNWGGAATNTAGVVANITFASTGIKRLKPRSLPLMSRTISTWYRTQVSIRVNQVYPCDPQTFN